EELLTAFSTAGALDFLQLDLIQVELVGDDRIRRQRNLEELDVILPHLHDLAVRLARHAGPVAARGCLGGYEELRLLARLVGADEEQHGVLLAGHELAPGQTPGRCSPELPR